MQNRHDRLTKYGVVALAGIAVLGWIREPEKHPFSKDSASASSAQSRATFSPPTDTAAVPGFVDRLPGDPASVRTNNPPHETDSPLTSTPTVERVDRKSVEADQQTPAVVKTRERAPANGGRHEGPNQSAEQPAATRSQEPGEQRPLESEMRDRAVRNPESQDDGALSPGQTQPVVSKKERSTARSAAIIAGAAAAGAAIGAATGGGKGAAIGAISGGAGGYVYDRMTRRKSGPDVPPVSTFDTDEEVDGPRYDRAPSLARRYGTPTFN